VKTVTESDNHYHFILKNNSSTKAGTPGSGDSDSENRKEFKLIKKDLYKERNPDSPKCDYKNLLSMIN